MKMAFCTNCGNQLGDTDKFCAKCGTAVRQNVPAAPVVPTAQPTETPVAAPAAAPAPAATAPISLNKGDIINFVKKNKKIVAVIAAALVIFIVLFSVFISSLNNCEVSGCNKNHAKGSDYCYSHKCAKSTCDNRRLSSGIYCSAHKSSSTSSSSSASSTTVWTTPLA